MARSARTARKPKQKVSKSTISAASKKKANNDNGRRGALRDIGNQDFSSSSAIGTKVKTNRCSKSRGKIDRGDNYKDDTNHTDFESSSKSIGYEPRRAVRRAVSKMAKPQDYKEISSDEDDEHFKTDQYDNDNDDEDYMCGDTAVKKRERINIKKVLGKKGKKQEEEKQQTSRKINIGENMVQIQSTEDEFTVATRDWRTLGAIDY